MYNATPAVAEAWRRLFAQVFADLDWPVRVIPHAWPASLKALWQRRDLVCGFMCGLPFAEHVAPVVPLVAPVPAAEAYGGLPRYRSELLVRRECGWRSLPDTFGQRFGWMVPHSQSGYQAARLLLAPYAAEAGKRGKGAGRCTRPRSAHWTRRRTRAGGAAGPADRRDRSRQLFSRTRTKT